MAFKPNSYDFNAALRDMEHFLEPSICARTISLYQELITAPPPETDSPSPAAIQMLCGALNELYAWSGNAENFMLHGLRTQTVSQRGVEIAFPATRTERGIEAKMAFTPEGAQALYWTGDRFDPRPFVTRHNYYERREKFKREIKQFVAERRLGEFCVVDFGAGDGALAFSIALDNAKCKALNVDMTSYRPLFGCLLAERFGLQDRVKFLKFDYSRGLAALGKEIRSVYRDFPIIAITSGALYPYLTEVQLREFFEFVLDDLQVLGGFHNEPTGWFTPDYAKFKDHFGRDFPFHRNWEATCPGYEKSDFMFRILNDLQSSGRIQVREMIGIVPEFIEMTPWSWFWWERR